MRSRITSPQEATVDPPCRRLLRVGDAPLLGRHAFDARGRRGAPGRLRARHRLLPGRSRRATRCGWPSATRPRIGSARVSRASAISSRTSTSASGACSRERRGDRRRADPRARRVAARRSSSARRAARARSRGRAARSRGDGARQRPCMERSPDLCYLTLHGKEGEDGTVQRLLDLLARSLHRGAPRSTARSPSTSCSPRTPSRARASARPPGRRSRTSRCATSAREPRW